MNSTPHVTFSRWLTFNEWLKLKFGVRSAHFTSSHASSSCAHVVCLILRDFSLFLFLLSTLSYRLVHLPNLQLLGCGGQRPLAPLPSTTLSQVMSPTTTTSRRLPEPYIQKSSGENGSLNSHDLEYDDDTIGMALSSPLFSQE